jgi:hypothetical protein
VLGIFAKLFLGLEHFDLPVVATEKVDEVDLLLEDNLYADRKTIKSEIRGHEQVTTHRAAFFECVWNWVDSQGTAELVPVDIFLIGPKYVEKLLLDGSIEFVADMFLILLAEAGEFGNMGFGRVITELGVLSEKPLEGCYPAQWTNIPDFRLWHLA